MAGCVAKSELGAEDMFPFTPHATPVSRGRKRMTNSAQYSPQLRKSGLLSGSMTPNPLPGASGSGHSKLVARLPDRVAKGTIIDEHTSFGTHGNWCWVVGDSICFWNVGEEKRVVVEYSTLVDRKTLFKITNANLCTAMELDLSAQQFIETIFIVCRRDGTVTHMSNSGDAGQSSEHIADVDLSERDELTYLVNYNSKDTVFLVSKLGAVYTLKYAKPNEATVKRLEAVSSHHSMGNIYSYVSSLFSSTFKGGQEGSSRTLNTREDNLSDQGASSIHSRSKFSMGNLYVLYKSRIISVWDSGVGGGEARPLVSVDLSQFLSDLSIGDGTTYEIEDFDVLESSRVLLLLSSTSETFSSLSISATRFTQKIGAKATPNKPVRSTRLMKTLNLIEIKLDMESVGTSVSVAQYGEMVRIYRYRSQDETNRPELVVSQVYPAVYVSVWPSTLVLATYPHILHRETSTIKFEGSVFSLANFSGKSIKKGLKEKGAGFRRFRPHAEEARAIVYPQGVLDIRQVGLNVSPDTILEPREEILNAIMHGRKEVALHILTERSRALSGKDLMDISDEILDTNSDDIWEDIWSSALDRSSVSATATSKTSPHFVSVAILKAKQMQHDAYLSVVLSFAKAEKPLELEEHAFSHLQDNRERLRALISLLNRASEDIPYITSFIQGESSTPVSLNAFFSERTTSFPNFFQLCEERVDALCGRRGGAGDKGSAGTAYASLEALEEMELILNILCSAFREVQIARTNESLPTQLGMKEAHEKWWIGEMKVPERILGMLRLVYAAFQSRSGSDSVTNITSLFGEMSVLVEMPTRFHRDLIKIIFQMGDFLTARDLSLRFRSYDNLFAAVYRASGGDDRTMQEEIKQLLERESGNDELILQLLDWYTSDSRRYQYIFNLPEQKRALVGKYLREKLPFLSWVFDIRVGDDIDALSVVYSEAMSKSNLRARKLHLSIAKLLLRFIEDITTEEGNLMREKVDWELFYASLCTSVGANELLPIEKLIGLLLERAAATSADEIAYESFSSAFRILDTNRNDLPECDKYEGTIWKQIVERDAGDGYLQDLSDAMTTPSLLYRLGMDFYRNESYPFILDQTFGPTAEEVVTGVLTRVNNDRKHAPGAQVHI